MGNVALATSLTVCGDDGIIIGHWQESLERTGIEKHCHHKHHPLVYPGLCIHV